MDEAVMQRDFDLIRKLLLELENSSEVDLSDYSDDDVKKYHKALLIEAGLAEGNTHYTRRSGLAVPDAVVLHRLTWAGHEFLDKAREDSVWKRAKALLREKGVEYSFDTLKLALASVITNILQ